MPLATRYLLAGVACCLIGTVGLVIAVSRPHSSASVGTTALEQRPYCETPGKPDPPLPSREAPKQVSATPTPRAGGLPPRPAYPLSEEALRVAELLDAGKTTAAATLLNHFLMQRPGDAGIHAQNVRLLLRTRNTVSDLVSRHASGELDRPIKNALELDGQIAPYLADLILCQCHEDLAAWGKQGNFLLLPDHEFATDAQVLAFVKDPDEWGDQGANPFLGAPQARQLAGMALNLAANVIRQQQGYLFHGGSWVWCCALARGKDAAVSRAWAPHFDALTKTYAQHGHYCSALFVAMMADTLEKARHTSPSCFGRSLRALEQIIKDNPSADRARVRMAFAVLTDAYARLPETLQDCKEWQPTLQALLPALIRIVGPDETAQILDRTNLRARAVVATDAAPQPEKLQTWTPHNGQVHLTEPCLTVAGHAISVSLTVDFTVPAGEALRTTLAHGSQEALEKALCTQLGAVLKSVAESLRKEVGAEESATIKRVQAVWTSVAAMFGLLGISDVEAAARSAGVAIDPGTRLQWLKLEGLPEQDAAADAPEKLDRFDASANAPEKLDRFDASFFTYPAGTRWVYRLANGETEVETFLGIERRASQECQRIDTQTGNGPVQTCLYSIRGDGVFLEETHPGQLPRPVKTQRFVAAGLAGRTAQNPVSVGGVKMWTETIRLPIGERQTVVIETSARFRDSAGREVSGSRRAWYAVGEGQVKSELWSNNVRSHPREVVRIERPTAPAKP